MGMSSAYFSTLEESVHRIIGSLGHWVIWPIAIGSPGQLVIGSSVHWLIGSLAHQIIGSSGHRFILDCLVVI
jgi:hypothetical protein